MTAAMTSSNFGTLAAAVTDLLRAENLEGIGLNWQTKTLPDIPFDPDRKFDPVGIVSPAPEKIREGAGTNGQQDVVYVLLVSMAQAANTDQQVALPRKLAWRERVRRLLHHKRSVLHSTGLLLVDVVVLKGSPTIPAVWRKHIDAQTLEIEITVRESYQ